MSQLPALCTISEKSIQLMIELNYLKQLYIEQPNEYYHRLARVQSKCVNDAEQIQSTIKRLWHDHYSSLSK